MQDHNGKRSEISGTAKCWFVHRQGTVMGPYSTQEVENRMHAGQFNADCWVWVRGAKEWSPMAEWPVLVERQAQVDQWTQEAHQPTWYVDFGRGEKPIGPISRNELVAQLVKLKFSSQLEGIKLWGSNLKTWTNVFEITDIFDLVGISRREVPRAPLMGEVAVTRAGTKSDANVVKAMSVSLNGISLKNCGFLRTGDHVQLSVKSHELAQILHAQAVVLYVGKTGDCGLRFTEISAEDRAMIGDHVRHFIESDLAAA
jgi:hypothetical protein